MGRPRKPLTREKRIAALEERLRKPEIGDKEYAALNRQLMILCGEIVPYSGRKKPEPKPDPPSEENLPTWWESMWRIFLIEHLAGCGQNQYSEILRRKYDSLPDQEKILFDVEAQELKQRHNAAIEQAKKEQADEIERDRLMQKLGVANRGAEQAAGLPKAGVQVTEPEPEPTIDYTPTQWNFEQYYKIWGNP